MAPSPAPEGGPKDSFASRRRVSRGIMTTGRIGVCLNQCVGPNMIPYNVLLENLSTQDEDVCSYVACYVS